MREQSLLEATCGDLFDHIDDLLDFPKEDSAADVLLLDAPAPGSPLSARIIDVGRAGNALAPPAPPALAPPPPAQHDASAGAFFAAAGPDVFDTKDVVGAHIGSVSPPLPSLPPRIARVGRATATRFFLSTTPRTVRAISRGTEQNGVQNSWAPTNAPPPRRGRQGTRTPRASASPTTSWCPGGALRCARA